MLTWTEPDTTPSVFNLFLIVVLIDEVKLFNELVEVSMALTLVNALDVNEFKLPVLVSMALTLVNALDVNEFKELVEVSIELNLVFWFKSVVAIEDDNEPKLELYEPLKIK